MSVSTGPQSVEAETEYRDENAERQGRPRGRGAIGTRSGRANESRSNRNDHLNYEK